MKDKILNLVAFSIWFFPVRILIGLYALAIFIPFKYLSTLGEDFTWRFISKG